MRSFMQKRTLALVLLIVSALTVSVCAALQVQQQRMSEKIIRLQNRYRVFPYQFRDV